LEIPKSGQPASRSAVQNERRIVLPIDDPRNNPRYRHLHPNVVFEGKSEKKHKKAKHHTHHKKHDHHTKTKKHHHGHHSHAHPTAHNPVRHAGQNADDDMEYSEYTEVDGDDEYSNDQGEDFAFHEMIGEEYDVHSDGYENNGWTPTPIGTTNGTITTETVTHLAPPQNIRIEVTPDAQTNSGDGIPTYMAALYFSSDAVADDYEIRIVKQ
jgi:hypothetical protein